jgi:transcriptional regulator GlxA family with amidase domain
MKNDHGFSNPLNIGILVFDDFEPLDVWGFIEPFSIARFIGTSYGSAKTIPFKISLIANEDSHRAKNNKQFLVKSYNGPYVATDYFRDEALKQHFDVLMIPGGFGVGSIVKSIDKSSKAQSAEPSDSLKELLEWVCAMDQKVSVMSSVCTGAAILASTGLLDGKAATTNHQAFAWVTTFGPKVLWDNISRWVDANKYVTSAGVSAGTDMGFYLVSRLAGRAVAEAAAISAEYDWHRDPNKPIYYPQQAHVPSSLPKSK